jgi:DNA helicase-2/ATP-dependent DNA helicase PcrA
LEQYALEWGLSLWNALPKLIDENLLPARAEAAIRAFIALAKGLSETAQTRPVHETLREILAKTGYEEMLKGEASPDSESRLANLQELVNAAAEAAERGETVADFLDHAALVADSDELDERATVSLLTMHNAKGLEFSNVFLAGMEEGLFPHSRSLTSEAAMEEERRLCYVGMTRAQRRLYLSWARYRRRFGGAQPEVCLPSRFLNEVPPSLRENLSSYRERHTGDVDLYSEQHEVRESVKRNLYTGRTYNSVENIAQFFNERGITPPSGFTRRPEAAKPPERDRTQQMPIPRRPAGPPSRKALPQISQTVHHPKYGRGIVVRREGDGEDAKLTVSFPGYGLKKIVAKYAGIKVDE